MVSKPLPNTPTLFLKFRSFYKLKFGRTEIDPAIKSVCIVFSSWNVKVSLRVRRFHFHSQLYKFILWKIEEIIVCEKNNFSLLSLAKCMVLQGIRRIITWAFWGIHPFARNYFNRNWLIIALKIQNFSYWMALPLNFTTTVPMISTMRDCDNVRFAFELISFAFEWF